ncbi:hypothetical protein ACFE04_025446 [Oxalis oulophora]
MASGSNGTQYPEPEARYEDVVANSTTFMSTLEKFHATMGTKFMIPVIGGNDLDLHRLFVEVTSRGGIEKVIRERKWKEVTSSFSFPSTATNASFILRKYYGSLLHHYEQAYYFKSRVWTPLPAGSVQNSATAAASPVHGAHWRSPEIGNSQAKIKAAESPAAQASSLQSAPVTGVIDGKFDGGYLVTVTVGSEQLKGVLYQTPQNDVGQVPHQDSVLAENPNVRPAIQRRRRRKKSEIKRRDPHHPKPNRSGYNFFFAEQHARLKPLHPGKDRDISRMIGELWTNLQDPERVIYKEQALRDKERYRREMVDYRERQRTGQLLATQTVAPLLFQPGQHMVEVNVHSETGGGESSKTYNEGSFEDSTSEESDMDVDVEASAAILGLRETAMGTAQHAANVTTEKGGVSRN